MSQSFEEVKELYKVHFPNFDLHHHWKIQDNNNQLWQQNQPSFAICLSIGKK